MDELNKLIGRLKEIDGEQAAIEAAADKDSGGVLSDEQRAEYDNLSAEYGETKARRDTLAADLEKRSARANRADDFKIPVQPRRTSASASGELPEPDKRHANAGPIPSWVRRSGSLEAFKGEVEGRSAQERAFRFGMWGRHVLGMEAPKFRRQRIADFAEAEWGDPQMAAHGENDAFGSDVLVPEEFSNDLEILRLRYGVSRTLFNVQPMNRDTFRISIDGDDLIAYFVAENNPIPESNVTASDRMLVAKKIAALSRWSNELNDDAIIDFGDRLARSIGRAFALKEDQCCLLGDGTSAYGGIVGLIPAMANASSIGVKAQATGNTLAALTLKDFVGVPAALPDYAGVGEPKWLMSKSVYFETVTNLLLAAGGNTAADLTGGIATPRLLGYPVEFSNLMPSATAVGTVFALFGDFKLAGTFGDRKQETITFSAHGVVGGQSMFERDQLGIRGTERFDFVATNVGDTSKVGAVAALKTGS